MCGTLSVGGIIHLPSWFWPKISDRKNAQFAISESCFVARDAGKRKVYNSLVFEGKRRFRFPWVMYGTHYFEVGDNENLLEKS
jgi:hypothetical protein